MRILAIDIETTPNLAHVWGLWNQNVGLSQLVEPTEMLCFAAKWVGVKAGTAFFAGRHAPGGDHAVMVHAAHDLLSEADVVLHYNGKRFDVPHLSREFLELGLVPPAPFRQIDLLETVRKRFKFPSNKLAYVTKTLGFKGKVGVDFDLWRACMQGEPAAWRRMERYNRRDVLELVELYEVLKPWIVGAPNVGTDPENDGEDVCPSCGSSDLRREGYAYTSVSRYQRLQCRQCGRWSRSGKREAGTSLRAVAE